LESPARQVGAPSCKFDTARQVALLTAIDDRKHDSLLRFIVGCRDLKIRLVGEVLGLKNVSDCTITFQTATLPGSGWRTVPAGKKSSAGVKRWVKFASAR